MGNKNGLNNNGSIWNADNMMKLLENIERNGNNSKEATYIKKQIKSLYDTINRQNNNRNIDDSDMDWLCYLLANTEDFNMDFIRQHSNIPINLYITMLNKGLISPLTIDFETLEYLGYSNMKVISQRSDLPNKYIDDHINYINWRSLTKAKLEDNIGKRLSVDDMEFILRYIDNVCWKYICNNIYYIADILNNEFIQYIKWDIVTDRFFSVANITDMIKSDAILRSAKLFIKHFNKYIDWGRVLVNIHDYTHLPNMYGHTARISNLDIISMVIDHVPVKYFDLSKRTITIDIYEHYFSKETQLYILSSISNLDVALINKYKHCKLDWISILKNTNFPEYILTNFSPYIDWKEVSDVYDFSKIPTRSLKSIYPYINFQCINKRTDITNKDKIKLLKLDKDSDLYQVFKLYSKYFSEMVSFEKSSDLLYGNDKFHIAVEIIKKDKEGLTTICDKYPDRLDWARITKYKSRDTISFLYKYRKYIDWELSDIYTNPYITYEFINKVKYFVSWEGVSRYIFLDINFIEENLEYLQPVLSTVYENQSLTEDFMRNHQDIMNWNIISKYQVLSESFIEEFIDKLNIRIVIKNQYTS